MDELPSELALVPLGRDPPAGWGGPPRRRHGPRWREGEEGLYSALPLLWALLSSLPAGHGGTRAAVVRCLGRLGQHAHATTLAAQRGVMQSIIALLADPSAEVATACSVVLPRLLGSASFVRVVGLNEAPCEEAEAEAAVVDGQLLHDTVIAPMVSMLLEPASASDAADRPPHFRLALMAALGAIGRESLYAHACCRGAVVLALSAHLGRDELSQEYGCAMRELRSLAAQCGREGYIAEGTTEALCRALSPQLAAEWAWWLTGRPEEGARAAALHGRGCEQVACGAAGAARADGAQAARHVGQRDARAGAAARAAKYHPARRPGAERGAPEGRAGQTGGGGVAAARAAARPPGRCDGIAAGATGRSVERLQLGSTTRRRGC